MKRKTQDGSSSILAQPAQRFQRPRVSFAEVSNNAPSQPKRAIDSTGKRDVKRPGFQPVNKPRINQKSPENGSLKKDVRRRTVYIPEEDTTVPTVFMSLFSPLKSTDTNLTAPADETLPIYSLEARIAAKKKSSVEKPRRAPLQPSRKITQQSTIVRDVVGKNGGKENVPPGYIIGDEKCTAVKDPLSTFQEISKKGLKDAPEVVHSVGGNVVQPGQSKKSACKPIGEKSSKALMAKSNIMSMNGSLSKKQDMKRRSANNGSSLYSKNSKESPVPATRSAAPTRLSVPKVRPVSIDQQYPRFSNDISNPAMYEDDWLSHQEVVITQLVNGLFDSVGGKLHLTDSEVLRHELLRIYQSDGFLLLYKRLQASILYGALAPPRDILRRGSRLPDDLGMKRGFLNFWSDTYDLHALRAAAEVVVGRKMTVHIVRTSDVSSGSAVKQHKALKRAIDAFLETFLIQNMDKGESGDMQSGVVGGPYRRTILRSIMIIVLLDKARLTPGNSLPRCLFISSCPYKSSSAALQTLANLLLPSMGDINRQLNHLDCRLSYNQHQLQSYEFQIHNLAVDLRDGVMLTRLVEILLYPNASRFHNRRGSIGSSAMIHATVLPGDETAEYPLSQSLKFPCVSRAAKIFNVQIALDALKGVAGINDIAKELSAEHIVDGYREKTIALLWLLVGKWGLAEMLDWDDARNEIVRLQKKLVLCQRNPQRSKPENLEDLVHDTHEDLLIKWASALAQLKGLELVDLTASFADGKIFESIICEYECFLLGRQNNSREVSEDVQPTTADKGSLQSRLQALGCSTQFGRQMKVPMTSYGALTDIFYSVSCSRLDLHISII